MEGPFNHPHPHLHLSHHRRTPSLEEVLERQAATLLDRQSVLEGRQSVRSSVKDCQESTASSAVSSEYSREGTGGDQWYKPYCYQDQDNQHLEEHDNSHDSGTASTTLCSSSPSSSPSPSMLTQGNLTGTNLPPLSRAGLPPPPPPHLTAAHVGQLGRRHPGLNDQHENSYAEIPYGSLPVNNFDLPPGEHRGKLHLANPSGRNEWKNNNTVNPNSNLVHNLHLALDYPTRNTVNPTALQQGQNHHFRMLDASAGAAPSERQTSMIHLRDGHDGLYPVPQPRMTTMDVPASDFKGSERYRKRKWRQTLIMVVVMALAGVAYLALGGMSGYYFGKAECDKRCSSRPFIAGAVAGNSTTTYAFTTPHPGINGSTGNGSSTPEAGISTTPTATPTTPTTTVAVSTTEPPPRYCVQVNSECHCGPLGGSGGKEFNDREDYLHLGNITGFTVKHNDYFISGLQMQYGSGSGAEHGYTEGGFRVNVQLLRGEHITAVEADFTSGRGYLSRLVVHTDRRILGPYGGQGGLQYPLNGAKLLYILGRSGPMIDRLGFVFDRCT